MVVKVAGVVKVKEVGVGVGAGAKL